MNNIPIPTLENQAIQATKNQDWELALSVNLSILEIEPNNVPALMRSGIAYVQLNDKAKAKDAFDQVLTIDKSNALAKKHLLKLKNNQKIILSHLPTNEEFIEEPGKSKTVDLHRLAGKDTLESLSVGQVCTLKSKNRFISVESNKVYIGSLPEDLSARLSKLIAGGNTYMCYIQSLSSTSCTVFIKEATRSKHNEFIHSFPVSKSQSGGLNDMYLSDDSIPLQMEDIPLQLVETDADDEKTPDRFDIDEPAEETPVEDDDQSN